MLVRASTLTALFALVLATMAAPSFCAEPTAAERETARALLKEGDWLVANSKHAEALERYRAAHAIMGLPTTGMSVVRSLAATGHLVEARDLAIQIARSAPGKPDKPTFAAARSEAAATASSLEPRIPDLTIRIAGVSTQGAAAEVTVDQAPIPAAAIGHPWKLNPGKHVIEARAPGKASARVERTLAEGDHATVEFALVELAQPASPGDDTRSAPVEPSAPPMPAAVTAPAPDATRATTRSGSSGSSKTLAYALTGVGAASLTAGLAFGWKALERKGYRDDHCDASGCDAAALDADSEGRTWATWSTVAAGAGAAALGVGLYLILSKPGARPPATATITPVGRHGAALTVRW